MTQYFGSPRTSPACTGAPGCLNLPLLLSIPFHRTSSFPKFLRAFPGTSLPPCRLGFFVPPPPPQLSHLSEHRQHGTLQSLHSGGGGGRGGSAAFCLPLGQALQKQDPRRRRPPPPCLCSQEKGENALKSGGPAKAEQFRTGTGHPARSLNSRTP